MLLLQILCVFSSAGVFCAQTDRDVEDIANVNDMAHHKSTQLCPQNVVGICEHLVTASVCTKIQHPSDTFMQRVLSNLSVKGCEGLRWEEVVYKLYTMGHTTAAQRCVHAKNRKKRHN